MVELYKIDQYASEDHLLPQGDWVSQLCLLCMKRHTWSMPSYQYSVAEEPEETLFTCFCRVVVNEKVFDTSSCATRKKISKQLSSWRMLELLSNEYDVEVPETGDKTEVEEDYVYRLQDYCLSHIDVTSPWYRFTKNGPQHHIIYSCSCSVKTLKGIIEYNGSANRKYFSKQLAAKRMLEFLLAEGRDITVEKKEEPLPAIDITTNFTSRLRKLCESEEGFSVPHYELKEMHSIERDAVTCVCEVTTLLGEQNVTALERTKNLARHVAAKKMIDLLALTTTDIANKAEAFRRLVQICKLNGWQEPIVEFQTWGDSHKPIFTCRISIQTSERSSDAIGIGETKKQAQKASAVELLRSISSIPMTQFNEQTV